jgi:hypothetical protein
MHSLWAAKVESRMGAVAWAMRQRSGRYKTMTLPAHEFIRRFLTHVLPSGFPHDTSYPSPQLGEVWPSQCPRYFKYMAVPGYLRSSQSSINWALPNRARNHR